MLATMLLAMVVMWPQWTPVRDVRIEPLPLVEAPRPVCVTFSTEARFVGLAYNHIVHVANGCSVPQSCAVTTNVNSEPQILTVPSGSRVEVVTFIGSPARTFTADVRCSPEPVARKAPVSPTESVLLANSPPAFDTPLTKVRGPGREK
jgi:hypothetical protein